MTAILVKRRQIADMDYRTLYFYLFNQITDAVEELDAGMYAEARERLAAAQSSTEEQVISADENGL